MKKRLPKSRRTGGRMRFAPLCEVRMRSPRGGRDPVGARVPPGTHWVMLRYLESGPVRIVVYNESKFDPVWVR